jgi:hypothetical protein
VISSTQVRNPAWLVGGSLAARSAEPMLVSVAMLRCHLSRTAAATCATGPLRQQRKDNR